MVEDSPKFLASEEEAITQARFYIPYTSVTDIFERTDERIFIFKSVNPLNSTAVERGCFSGTVKWVRAYSNRLLFSCILLPALHGVDIF